jgi:hypothetical protein
MVCFDVVVIHYRRFIAKSWLAVLTAARDAPSLCCKTAAFGHSATIQEGASATMASRNHTPRRSILHQNHRHHHLPEPLTSHKLPIAPSPVPLLLDYTRAPLLVE